MNLDEYGTLAELVELATLHTVTIDDEGGRWRVILQHPDEIGARRFMGETLEDAIRQAWEVCA